jgi:predicted transcriptional regulator
MSSIIEAFKSRDQERRPIARRSTLETCLDILRAIKSGSSTSTTIMYNANVSWEAMQDNLKILCLAGLVSAFGSKNRRKYEITQKGERLVLSYEEIIGTMTEFMNNANAPQQIAPAVVA